MEGLLEQGSDWVPVEWRRKQARKVGSTQDWGWAKEGAGTEERIGRPGLLLCLIPP